jgi:60 kDa SS-A/Ro ribonucleoprotein
MRLDKAMNVIRNFSWGGTDCSLLPKHARENKYDVDVHLVITDNDTWSGQRHTVREMQAYRKARQMRSKMIVAGTTATDFTIADPNDPDMLDIVGFDSAFPQLIQQFALV